MTITDATVAEHVSGLRAACSAEMRAVMDRTKESGNVANSADALYVYELAAAVLQCNKLSELIQKREAQS